MAYESEMKNDDLLLRSDTDSVAVLTLNAQSRLMPCPKRCFALFQTHLTKLQKTAVSRQ